MNVPVCPDVDVAIKDVPFHIQQVTAEELGRGRQGWPVIALTRAALGYSATSSGKCLDAVRVQLVDPVILFDKRLTQCQWRFVNRHEQKHVQVAREALAAFAAAVKAGRDPDEAMTESTARINERNRAIDTDAEYHQVTKETKECPE